MFEGIISEILGKYLKKYIKDFNSENLQLGIFGGNVSLADLEINPEALVEFNVPFSIKKGVIGKLELSIPWRNLKSKPVVVQIADVFILVEPQYDYSKYDPVKAENAARNAKKTKLENAEAMQALKQKDDKQDSFTQKLITKIIDNLQVEVSNIHICVEDFSTNKNYPFSFGICLKSLQLKSTDESWNEKFVEERLSKLIYKVAHMKHLSIYATPNEKTLSHLTIPEMQRQFRNMISTSINDTQHRFLIKPISAHVKLILNTSDVPVVGQPKMAVKLSFEDIFIEIEEMQYQTLLKLVNSLANYEKVKKNLKYRPLKIRPTDQGGAKIWWKYVGNVILEETRDRLQRRSWKFLFERRKNRKLYIDLYKRKKGGKWLKSLSKEDLAVLDSLENALSFEDILFFRSLANKEYEEEAKNSKAREEYEKKNKKGWFSGWFGGSSKEEEVDENKPGIQLTPEQKQAIYDTIDFNEVVSTIEPPKEFVKIHAELEMRNTNLSLILSNGRERALSLITFLLTAVNVVTDIRVDSLKATVGIRSFELEDKFTKQSSFPYIVSKMGQRDQDLLSLDFEQNPLDHHSDAVLNLEMLPLCIAINRYCLERIAQFFAPPKDVSELSQNIKQQAVKSVYTLSVATRAQLEDAIKTHKSIDLNIKINAPVIIVPQTPTSPKSPLLILDLGFFSLKSDLRDVKKSTQYEVIQRNESDFYDKFDLSLKAIKLLLVQNKDEDWQNVNYQKEKKLQLIQEFDINISLENCISPDEVSLTKLKFYGSLPQFTISVSDTKIGQVMNLINALTAPSPNSIPTEKKSSNTANIDLDIPSPSSNPIVIPEKVEQEKKDNTAALVARKLFDARFELPSISLILCKGEKEHPLIQLQINKISISFVQRTFDMQANLVLGEFQIEDYIQQLGHDFQYLGTSHLGPVEDSQLINVSFQQIKKESPEYSKIETILEVHFSSFYFLINRDSIAQLIEFVLLDLLPKLPKKEITQEDQDTPVEKEEQKVSTKKIQSPSPKISSSLDIKLKASIEMKTFGIYLNQEGEIISEFFLSNFQAGVEMREKTLKAFGYIGDMSIIDSMSQNEGYSKILSIVKEDSQHMLDFEFLTFSPYEGAYEGIDASIKAQMRSIRFFFINSFITELKNFFLGGPIMKALSKQKPVPPKPSESSRKSVKLSPPEKEVTEPAKRNKLNVIIQTPQIIVPRNSFSKELIKIDLGQLILENLFDEKPIEHLKIVLQSTNIISVIKTSQEEFVETALLQDFTVTLAIHRLLDLNENAKYPQFDIKIDVSSIEFFVSEAQAILLFAILNENIKEGMKAMEPSEPPSTKLQEVPEEEVISRRSSFAVSPLPIQQKKDTSSFTKVQLSFDLQKIGLYLLRGIGTVRGKHDIRNGLASFDINQMSASLFMTINSSMKLKFSIVSLRIEDIRPDTKNKFPHLLTPNEDPGLTQVSLNYESQNQQQDISLKIIKPGVRIVPEFLFEVQEFFVSAVNVIQPLAEQGKNKEKKDDEKKPNKEDKKKVEHKEKEPTKEKEAPSIPINFQAIKANVSIDNPNIYLLHDPTNKFSKAISVDITTINIDFSRDKKEVDQKERIQDDSNLQINSFQAFLFVPNNPSVHKLPIIKPFDINITYMNWEKEQDIIIDIHPIATLLSYQDFRMVNEIINSSKPPKSIKKEPSPSKLEEERSSPEVQPSQVKSFSSTRSESLQMECPRFYLCIINDFNGRNIPLLELFTTDIKAAAKNWSSFLSVDVSLGISANYWNNNIVEFEPLIEDWAIDARIRKGDNPELMCYLKSEYFLNINISNAFIESVGAVMDVLNKDFEAIEKLKSSEKYSPYWIINEIGVPITIEYENFKQRIENESKYSVDFLKGTTKFDYSRNQVHYIAIEIENAARIESVPLDKVGIYFSEIYHKKLKRKVQLMCEVTLHEGSKVLKIFSLIHLENHTNIPLEFGLFNDLNDKDPAFIIGPIAPYSSKSIPLYYTLKCFVTMRPSGSTKWRKEGFIKLEDVIASNKTILDEMCSFETENNEIFYCLFKSKIFIAEFAKFRRLTLIFYTPLIIENLIPYDIEFTLQSEGTNYGPQTLIKADSVHIHHLNLTKDIKLSVHIPGYKASAFDFIYHGLDSKKEKRLEYPSSLVCSDNDGKKNLVIQLDNRCENEIIRKVTVYCNYWVLNKTTLPMVFRQNILGGSKEQNNFTGDIEPSEETKDQVKPILFSFNGNIIDGSGKMVLRVNNSEWSKPFNVDSLGASGIVQVSNDQYKYELSVNLYIAPGKFERTKIVEINQRILIRNSLDHSVFLKQIKSNNSVEVKANGSKPFYYWDKKGLEELTLRDGEDWTWCGGFKVDSVDNFKVKTVNNGTKQTKFISINIAQEYGASVVTIYQEQTPPYLLENDTSFTLFYFQKNIPSQEKLDPHSSCEFTWEEHSKLRILHVHFENKKHLRKFKLDAFTSFDPIHFRGKTIYSYLKANGVTRVLCYTENKEKFINESDSSEKKTEVVEKTDFHFFLKGFGISFINSKPEELLYIAIEDIALKFNQSNLGESSEIVIRDFQINNQLYNARYPIVLACPKSHTKNESDRVSFLKLSLTKKFGNSSIDYYSYLALLIQELKIQVDGSFIKEVLEFYKNLNLEPLARSTVKNTTPYYSPMVSVRESNLENKFSPGTYYFAYAYIEKKLSPLAKLEATKPFSEIIFTNLQSRQGYDRIFYISQDGNQFVQLGIIPEEDASTIFIFKLTTDFDLKKISFSLNDKELQEDEENLATSRIKPPKPQKKMYFKTLELSPIKLYLTFSIGHSMDTSSNNPLRVLVQLLGSTIANIDNAPVRLNALKLTNAFGTPSELIPPIQQHYIRQGILEVYKILGSADFLGNPVGLFDNLTSGVKDFFYEPYKGFVESPAAFGTGLAKGTASLLKHSVYGTFNTTSKVTGTVGTGLARLTFDPKYLERREKKKLTEQPKHAGYGLLYGARDLLYGLGDGLAGPFYQPFVGAKEEGAKGFLIGLGRGMIGIPLKPAVGAIDLVTSTTEGIRNTTTLLEPKIVRTRPPRLVSHGHALLAYEESEAIGTELLHRVEDGAYQDESYLYHAQLPNQNILLLSHIRMIMLSPSEEQEWMVPYENVTSLKFTNLGILVTLNIEPDNAIIPIETKNENGKSDPLPIIVLTKLGAAIKSRKESLRNETPTPTPRSIPLHNKDKEEPKELRVSQLVDETELEENKEEQERKEGKEEEEETK